MRNNAAISVFALVAGMAGLTAQSPPDVSAPADNQSAPQLPSKPLRSLRYNFQVDYQQNGEGHTGDIGTGGSGIRSMMTGAGRTGVLDADIMGLGKDGGLVVRVSEWLQEQPRAQQSYICAVYPNGSVVCPEELDVSDAETELMSFLGRGWYDSSLVDANHHWTRSYSNKFVSVDSTFAITSAADASPLAISELSTITSKTGAFRNWKVQATLTYDPNLEVPVKIHDVGLQQDRGSASLQTIMDFQLTEDSFAKKAP